MKKTLEQRIREAEKGYYCTIKDCLVVIELYKKALRIEKRKVKNYQNALDWNAEFKYARESFNKIMISDGKGKLK